MVGKATWQKGRRRPAGLALIVVLPLLLAACASDQRRIPVGTPEPDRYLFERGTEALESRRWIAAREWFRQIVDGYPQSAHRAEAKLGIGDAYLGENTTESNVLAIGEFREFLTFFPTHPRADYAQFRLAMAHYNQMLRPERDQTQTKEAVREFETFVERYPNSALLDEARMKLREARDRLSESEYRVGLFYYRNRWYPGAIDRLRGVLSSDPEYTHRDAVYFYLAEALVRSNQQAEALPYYERILSEFEQSEYLRDAERRIQELKNGTVLGRR